MVLRSDVSHKPRNVSFSERILLLLFIYNEKHWNKRNDLFTTKKNSIYLNKFVYIFYGKKLMYIIPV